MFCRSMTLTQRDTSSITARPLLCKCWKCETCRDMLKAKVVAKACRGHPTTFLTLTSNPRQYPNPDDAANALKHAFTTLIRKLRRDHPHTDIQYLAVFEQTKQGMPHLHVLLRAPYVRQKTISNYMRDHIAAPIVDIRKVGSPNQVARYIGKYLSKDPHRFDGCQRYWHTRAWVIPDPDRDPPPSNDNPWHLWRWSLETCSVYLHRLGYEIEWHADNPDRPSFIAHEPPTPG